MFLATKLFVVASSEKSLPNAPTSNTPHNSKPSRDRKEAVAATVHECSPITTNRKYKTGPLLSMNRVASTAAEKLELRNTGAAAVEMEAAAVAAKAQEWNLPFYAIRVVTDTAAENFPLDFNRMRDSTGRFNRAKIIRAAFRNPVAIFPELLKLNKRCKSAAKALGEFIADSRI